MITLLKIGVEVEGDRSHVLISLVGQVLTNIIRRHVYWGLVDAKSTCQPIVGWLPVAMLFKLVDYQSPLSVDTWSICWSTLGWHLNHYIAIDSWQPTGGLSVVYMYRLFCWNGSHLLVPSPYPQDEVKEGSYSLIQYLSEWKIWTLCPLNWTNPLCFYLGLNPLHPKVSMHILRTVLWKIFQGADKENLFNNQELP